LSPILGIIASQNYSRITGSYESIATVTVGSGGSSTITFNSIPSTYKHLQVRLICRSNFVRGAGSTLGVTSYLRVGNGGSIYATGYAWGSITGDGSTINAENYGSQNTMVVANQSIPAANSPTSVFGVTIVDILDYANTNKNKTVRYLAGFDQNGTNGRSTFATSLYAGTTNAITDLEFSADGAFVEYSQFALYGIKG
jgi:hypothetical protein